MARARSGDIVGGRYRLERQIGEGGMAAVWRATDLTLERHVALKFLFAADERRREVIAEEFLREAKLAASVNHRNVVHVLDFGRHDDGTPFMVMELLEGESLGDRFDRGEMFELRFIVELLADVLQGLAAVHDAGIVHRDLKPENIFLVRDRGGVYPKLLDFGISKSVSSDTGRRSAVTTRDGRVVGTPEYMSPEQARGLRDIDKRTDVYSMGVVLYEAIAGHAPYESENVGDLLIFVIQGGAPPLSEEVPGMAQGISDVVARAMHRERGERYGDASELREALLRALEQTVQGYSRKVSAPPPMRSRHRQGRSADTTLHSPAAAGDSAAQPAGATAATASAGSETPARGRGPLVVAGLVALLVVAGVTLWGMLPRATAPSEPRFIVVQSEAPTPTSEPSPPPASEPSPPPASVPASVEEPAAGQVPVEALPLAEPQRQAGVPRAPKAKPRAAPTVASARAPDEAAALDRAFQRQKEAVVNCFDRYPDAVSSGATLSVRVELEKTGRVRSAAVSPAPVAGGELGRCIGDAVRGMRFAPLAEPVAFRVPLRARARPPTQR